MDIRVIDINEGTSVDGPGLRTSIYLAGCPHHCHGCHNPQTWNPDQGRVMSTIELFSIIEDSGMNVTFSGGDPLMQPGAVTEVVRMVKERLGRSVWLYTGYTFEQVAASSRLNTVLPWIDVMVDGPFVESLRDTSLLFRGSANQRLIDVGTWLADGKIRLWEPDF